MRTVRGTILAAAAGLSILAGPVAGAASEPISWLVLSPEGACVPAEPSAEVSASLEKMGGIPELAEIGDELEVTVEQDTFFVNKARCEAVREAAKRAERAEQEAKQAERMARMKKEARRVASAPIWSPTSSPKPPIEVYPKAHYLADESRQLKGQSEEDAWVFAARTGLDTVVRFYRQRLPESKTETKTDVLYFAETPGLDLRIEKRDLGWVWIWMASKPVEEQAPVRRVKGVTIDGGKMR